METPSDPQLHVSPPRADAGMDWRRIFVWALLICVSLILLGVIARISMIQWEWFGDTIKAAEANNRKIRRVAADIIMVFLYWRFARGIEVDRLRHVAVLFVFVHLVSFGFVFAAAGAGRAIESFNALSMARDFFALMIGMMLAGPPRIGPKGDASPPVP